MRSRAVSALLVGVLLVVGAGVGGAWWLRLDDGRRGREREALQGRLLDLGRSVLSERDAAGLEFSDDTDSAGGVWVAGDVADVAVARARLAGSDRWRPAGRSGDGTLVTYVTTSGSPQVTLELDVTPSRATVELAPADG